MIPFNPSLPNITKCQPIRAYRIDDKLALLVKNPKSLAESQGIGAGIIEYLYALALITSEQDNPAVKRDGAKARRPLLLR